MDLRGLSKIDLNLLIPLHVLLQERHVTRSAQRLRASQPAISRALARLRKYFGDPLLIKSGGALILTARARDLAPQVERFFGQRNP